MKTATGSGSVGYYVTDFRNFRSFTTEKPRFEESNHVLKEWELLAKAAQRRPDIDLLKVHERRLADPVLWNAIVADRRLYLGPNAAREQDYPSRFNHEELLAIVQTLIEELNALFDQINPSVVIGFICVTAAEYIAFLIAQARGIPFLDLRPTRLSNYFVAGETVQEPSTLLETTYSEFRTSGIPTKVVATTVSLLNSIRRSHAMYEGVLPPPSIVDTKQSTPTRSHPNLKTRLQNALLELRSRREGASRYDTHHQSRFAAHWFHRIRKPARLRQIERVLRPSFMDRETLAQLDYAFFPLHKEPEVTLLVYGRPFLNQIEMVRHVARSLPVGMKLVVKEHPGSIGYRPLGYYCKLLEIPNVVLAAPEMTSRDVLEHAKLVAIISGSVGLEAAVLGKPVIAFGRVPFSFLPETMLRTARAPDALADEIHSLLDTFCYDEEAMRAYVAAVITTSVPIDFYSVLIGRRGVYCPNGVNTDDYSTQIERLANYLINCAQVRSTDAPIASMTEGNTDGTTPSSPPVSDALHHTVIIADGE